MDVDHRIEALLKRRRSRCDCAPYRKPCTHCDAYWDGLCDMANEIEGGR